MNEVSLPPLSAQLEGLLFTLAVPTKIARLAKILEVEKDAVLAAATELQQFYESNQRGLSLLQQEESFQLVTSSAVSEIIQRYQKAELEGPLSKSALETLSIITYKGPITKPEIDTIRGVNSGIMLRTLLIRGLIDRVRSQSDARTFLYSLSHEFMRHLGVASVRDIPGYTDFSENKILEKLAESARVPLPGESVPHKQEDSTSDEETSAADEVSKEGA